MKLSFVCIYASENDQGRPTKKLQTYFLTFLNILLSTDLRTALNVFALDNFIASRLANTNRNKLDLIAINLHMQCTQNCALPRLMRAAECDHAAG